MVDREALWKTLHPLTKKESVLLRQDLDLALVRDSSRRLMLQAKQKYEDQKKIYDFLDKQQTELYEKIKDKNLTDKRRQIHSAYRLIRGM